jgi:tRNA1(Val) A37 N6-methylase TrmN6
LDDFLGGRLRLEQPARGFRSGQDAILLAAAVPARPGDQVLELGAGAGAAILALGTRVPGLALTALARSNAARNAFPLEVLEGDLRAPPESLRARAFDHVLLNPPYYDRSASTRASDPGRDLAHGGDAPVRAWLALAARRLRLRGTLTVIQRTARLPDLLAALPSGMGAAEVLPLAPRDGQPPATLLLRARKGSRAAFRLLAPLALHDGPGFARWAQAVLRDGAPLPWD